MPPTSKATPSLISIDATQFSSLGDMCAAIAGACLKLGSSASYPLGATIDARGFTGNQVCAASNITTMLFKCVPTTSNPTPTSGKLLLGEVNLYADGPIPPATSYTDNIGAHPSGIGTPALIIPSFFWGIEGVSRGASPGSTATHPPPGQGTFLSVCSGTGNPINNTNEGPGSGPCTTAFPKRSFSIVSSAVATTGGITTMTITIPDPLTAGTNIYLAELANVKGSAVTNENGTYKVQTINNSSGTGTNGTITVTVPSTTTGCSSNCGTLFLGTPILGFANTKNPYNDASCFTGLCSGFGEHIKDLGFNCQSYDGCIGWQNLYAQEESGADTFVINFYNFVGVDIHGGPENGTQNFGPVLNAEIYTGTDNTLCGAGTTGIYIGDSQMRGLNAWTINNSSESSGNTPACVNTPTAAVLFDAPNTEVSNGHCEGFTNCVLMGANNAPGSGSIGASSQKVSAVAGGPSCASSPCNVVHISNNYPNNSDYLIQNVRRHSFTNTIQDDVNGVSVGNVTAGSDPFTALYSWASGVNNTPSTTTTNILTTDPSMRNRFDSGIRTSSVASGLSTNTDLTGELNLSSATTASHTFGGSYASHPECTVVPQFNAGTTNFWVTYTVMSGTATFTVHFSSAVTGTVSYTCSART